VPRSEIVEFKNPRENGGKVRVDTNLILANQQVRILLRKVILRVKSGFNYKGYYRWTLNPLLIVLVFLPTDKCLIGYNPSRILFETI
jgi:hypothetical protein